MKKAVVLLSGGLDSTTTMACAINDGYEVIALSVLYGQRHSKEIESAKKVAEHYHAKHIILDMDMSFLHSSALTSKDLNVPSHNSADEVKADIPVTYVPARNITMLSLAAGLCESENGEAIYIGANSVDYSGYPDCRPEFFEAFQKVLNVGTKCGVEGHPVKIMTPILSMSKAEIVKLATKLGAPLQYTWSCYNGGEKACGHCDSCLLRLKGFEEAGIKDPVEYEESS